MTTQIKKMLIVALLLILTMTALAEVMYDWTASGSYSVGQSASYLIPEDGEMWLKLSGVKIGNEYTFITAGNDATLEVVYTYSEDGDIWDDVLSCSYADIYTPNQERCIVYYDDWVSNWIVIEDPEDREWRVTPRGYYLHVTGDPGTVTTLSSSVGVREEPIDIGREENPRSLKIGNSMRSFVTSAAFASYYCSVWLNAGQSYYFAASNLTVEADSSCAVAAAANTYYPLAGDEIGYEVRPEASCCVTLCISGPGTRLRYGPSFPHVWTYDMYAAAGVGRVISPDGVWSLPCDRTGARLDLYWSADAAGSGSLEVPTLAQEFVALGGGAVRTNLWNVGLSEKGFADCSTLTGLSLGSEFVCSQLPSFANCINLVTVDIPAGVAIITSSAFDGCTSLRSVSVAAGGAVGCVLNLPVPESDVKEDGVITHCTGWDDWNQGIASRQSFQIGEEGLDARMATLRFACETVAGVEAAYLYSYEGLAERVVVPSTVGGVPVLGIDWFGCSDSVREVEISEGVEEIAENAFESCPSLEHVSVPSSVWYVGNNWCAGCDHLMRVDFAGGELAGQWVDLPVSIDGDTRLWGWNEKSDGSGRWWGSDGLQLVPASGVSLYAIRTPVDFDFIQRDDGIVITHYGSQEDRGETFAVDRMAGQTVVGLTANALSVLSGYTTVRIAGLVQSIGDSAFEGSLIETLTNIVFEAGAMSRKDVNVPVPTAPEGMRFLGWRSSSSGDGETWSRYLWNNELGESRLYVRVPEGGASFAAVFVSDQIFWDESEDGIILNGFPIDEDAEAFSVPDNIAGRPVVGIGCDLLAHRSALASVSIPNSVRYVAEGAFSDTGIWNGSSDGLVMADGWVVGRKYEDEGAEDAVVIDTAVRGTCEGLFSGWSSLRTVSFTGALKNEFVWLPYADQSASSFVGWCTSEDGSGVWTVYDENLDAWEASVTNAVTYHAVFHDDGVSLEPVDGSGLMRIAGWGYASRRFTVPTEYDGCTISVIGSDAFCGQSDLQDLIIPAGIVSVGDGAFSFCDQLGSVRVAGTVASFGRRVFDGCNNLSNVVFEAGAAAGRTVQLPLVEDCEGKRFFGWRRKNAEGSAAWSRVVYDDEYGTDVCLVTVPDGGGTFEAVFVPDWIEWWEHEDGIVLTGYGLTCETHDFAVPSEICGRPVTGIADPLFTSCTELNTLTLPDSLTFVGAGVFDATPLVTNVVDGFIVVDGWVCGRQDDYFGRASRVALPPGVVGIAERAFADWSSLRRIELDSQLRVIGAGAFAGSGLVALSIPANVQFVAEDAFADCFSLRTLTIAGSGLVGTRLRMPDPSASGMTLLGWRATCSDGDVWSELEYDELNGVSSDVIYLPDADACVFSAVFCTGNYAWEFDWQTEGVNLVGSDSLSAQVTIPDRICGGTVVALASGAVSGAESVTEVTVPATVRRIFQTAFSSCPRLHKVVLQSGDTVVEGGAFDGCPQLAEIVVGPGEKDHETNLPLLEDVGYGQPVGWKAETSTGDVWSETVNDPQSGWTSCRVRVPQEGAAFKAVYDASGVYFEGRGTSLAVTGWPSDDMLPSDFEVPSNIAGRPVVEICSGAFGDGWGVRRLVIGEGVEIVQESAFCNFYELEEIVLPASLWYLSDSAFCDCPNLRRVVVPDGDLAGQTVRLPDVSREGETFVGWNSSPDGTGTWYGNGATISVPPGGVELNAVYAPFEAEWRKMSNGVVLTQCYGYPSADVVFDSFGGNPIVGIDPDGGSLDDCGVRSLKLGRSIKSMSDWAIRDWTSVTNIEFEAGALAGRRVWLPRGLGAQWDEKTQTDYSFAWWEGVDGKGEKFYVAWTFDDNSGEDGYALTVPESGAKLTAVFLPSWIQLEINGNGLILNGYGIEYSDVTCFDVPAEIKGRPVTRIGASLFAGCSMLAEVTIPESVCSIAEGAFNDTPMVSYAANELVYVDGWLVSRRFDNEDSITRLTLPEGTVGVADYVLRDLPVKRIDLPDTLRHVGWGAFAYTQLTQLTVPASVVSFAVTALAECRSLKSVSFKGTALAGTTIGLPAIDSNVEGKRFVGWSSEADGTGTWTYYSYSDDGYNPCELYCAVLPAESTTWYAQTVDDSLQWEGYYDDHTGVYGVRLTSFASNDEIVEIPVQIAGQRVVAIAGGAVQAEWAEEIVLPSSSVILEDGATIDNCPNLVRITFKRGEEETILRMPDVYDPEDRRFVGWCTSEDGNGDWSQYDEYEGANVVTVPAEGATYYAKWYADDGTWDWVEDGNGLCLVGYNGETSSRLVMPDKIACRKILSIHDDCWSSFDKEAITELILPSSMEVLNAGYNASFYADDYSNACCISDPCAWPRLKKVVLPSTLTEIVSVWAFGNACEIGAAGERYLGNWLVGYTSDIAVSKLVVREGTIGIADYALEDNTFYSEITLPASLRVVGACAFANCSKLSSVIFSGNAPATYIGECEYYGRCDDWICRAAGMFAGTPNELLVSVKRDSTGWNSEAEGLPAKWPEVDGRSIAYLGSGGAAEVLLSLSVYPADAGTVQGAGRYAAGSSVRIQTTASVGYEFLGWAGSATNAEAGIVDMGVCAVETLNVRESLNVVAVYRAAERYVSRSENFAFSPTSSTGASALSVPGSWLIEKGFATEGVTSTKTVVAALNAEGQNGIPVWQSYVLGLDPSEDKPAGEQLKVSIDGFDDEGKPVITFSPNRSDDEDVNSFVKYTLLGRESLSSGEWLDVNAVENAGLDFRFFRIQATVLAP